MINVEHYTSIQKAANAVPVTGGGLYFPAGIHRISKPVVLKDNTMVFGDGPSSILQKHGNAGIPLLLGLGVHNVNVNNLLMDVKLREGENYTQAIRFGTDDAGIGSYDCKVENVMFTVGEHDPMPGDTQMAVLSNNTNGLTVRNCRFDRMQLKASSKGDAGPCIITGNRFISPYNFAVSFVGEDSLDIQGGLILTDNIVQDLESSGAFFIGGDGETTCVGSVHSINISNNLIYGEWWDKAFAGIHLLMGQVTEDVIIHGNVVTHDGDVINNSGTIGISIKSPNVGGELRRCVITGNTVKNMDLHGIRVHVAKGSINGLNIDNNIVEDTRGIQVYGEHENVHLGCGNLYVGRGKGEVLTPRD